MSGASSRKVWIKVLASINDNGDVGNTPCPDCEEHRLEVRYMTMAPDRMGYLLFWCWACLHGISASRVKAPEGLPLWDVTDPRALTDVPDFVRHH
jgi:hypothetical protein